ncbi:MAG TPA: RNA methyltransferase [Acidimicrobiales bacterium]
MRRLRQLLRKRGLRATEQVVVVEGAELLSVAVAAGASIEAVYVAPEGAGAPAVVDVTDRILSQGGRVFDLAPGVMERVASTVTPQPLLAVVSYTPTPLDALDGASLVVVCVDVRDPGNLGTVIRTADAAGVDAVVCCDGTVDPTNPKCVRATAGSLFHVPVVEGGSTAAAVAALSARGFTTVASVVRGGTEYTAFDWTGPVALVLGNEAGGLPDDLVATLDAGVTIPMAGRSESLNVSVSAAVLCFEVLRQRRTAPSPGAPAARSTMSAMDEAPVRPDGDGGTG